MTRARKQRQVGFSDEEYKHLVDIAHEQGMDFSTLVRRIMIVNVIQPRLDRQKDKP